jgi:hypothetical protein
MKVWMIEFSLCMKSASEPLLADSGSHQRRSSRDVLMGDDSSDTLLSRAIARNPEFFAHAFKFGMCFLGLQM